jgi:hypothetical protein
MEWYHGMPFNDVFLNIISTDWYCQFSIMVGDVVEVLEAVITFIYNYRQPDYSNSTETNTPGTYQMKLLIGMLRPLSVPGMLTDWSVYTPQINFKCITPGRESHRPQGTE